jgi:hypothetical protein
MKKHLLLALALLASFFTIYAQDIDPTQVPPLSTAANLQAEIASNLPKKDPSVKPVDRPEAMWDFHFRYKLSDSASLLGAGAAPTYGIVWLDSIFLISNWSNNRVWIADSTGFVKNSFLLRNISTTSSIRGFTRVGNDIWGCNNTDSLFKISLKDSAVVKKVRMSGAGAIRWLSWDGSGFWCSNFSTNIWKVDTNGTVRQTIQNSAGQLNIPSIAGGVYDSVSVGGPYLWLNSQSTGNLTIVRQLKLSPLVTMGSVRNVNVDMGTNTNTAGGMTILKFPTRSKPTLVSLQQGTGGGTVGYELDFALPQYPDIGFSSADLVNGFGFMPAPLRIPNQYEIRVNNTGGAATPANAKFSIDLSKNSGTPTVLSVPFSAPILSSALIRSPILPTTGVGNYHAFLLNEVTNDLNLSNDTLTSGRFALTDSTFGRDIMDLVPNSQVVRVSSSAVRAYPRGIGMTYNFPAPVSINSVTVHFRATKINDSFNIAIFKMRNGRPADSLGSSFFYKITPGNDTASVISFGNRATLRMRTPVQVSTTDTILIAVQETDSILFIASTLLNHRPNIVWLRSGTVAGGATTWIPDTDPAAGINLSRAYVIRPNITIRTNTQEVKGNVDNLSIAPNPTHGDLRVRLELSQADQATIQIFDLAGKLVFSEKQAAAKLIDKQLNINYLASGMYLLNVQTVQGGRAFSKFVKE